MEELEEELQQAELEESKAKEEEQEEGETKDLDGLSSEEKAQVKAMAARDAEVRTHEQAHKAVGGSLTGSISYSTEKGPDGKDYAIGGHVPIDVSPGKDPEETIQKAARIQAAALAPADPSPADKSVASKAAQMASEARVAAADQARAEAQAAEAQAAEESEAPEEVQEAAPAGVSNAAPRPGGERAANRAPSAAQVSAQQAAQSAQGAAQSAPPGLAKAAAQYARWAA